ncbi:MAG: phosphoribosyltransferase [Betaproteobacteria bacterium]|nr:phosphoribosyltransferase [Betaproteobacteria bacterium]
MLEAGEARRIFKSAELLVTADDVNDAVHRVAAEISATLATANPLILSVMSGAIVFTGQLLPLLQFPLDLDYVHLTRYGDATVGGRIEWKRFPDEKMAGRTVLIVDDILDEGHTMIEIRRRVLESGAHKFYSAVFADKALGRKKPINADFVGVTLPDRYVFGFGLDIKGAWRNLPAVYAMKQE